MSVPTRTDKKRIREVGPSRSESLRPWTVYSTPSSSLFSPETWYETWTRTGGVQVGVRGPRLQLMCVHVNKVSINNSLMIDGSGPYFVTYSVCVGNGTGNFSRSSGWEKGVVTIVCSVSICCL